MQDSDKNIVVLVNDETAIAEKGALIAPLEAEENQSLVRSVVFAEHSSGKHAAHALSQIAQSMFEEGEIESIPVLSGGNIIVQKGKNEFVCDSGLVIAWTENGVKIWNFEGADVGKLLKIVYRVCTRWIRLDVR